MAARRVCSIDGCGKRHFGRGFCNAHYTRWKKYGDPSEGKPTPASPGVPLNWLWDLLSREPGEDCVLWPFGRSQNGYGAVKDGGEQVGTHRWVCEKVHGPPPGLEHHAAHSCGNGHLGCVSPWHLRWATPTENMADNVVMGRTNRNRPGSHRSLTPEVVRQIRDLRGAVTQRELARRYGTTQGNVGLIQRREIWGWLD